MEERRANCRVRAREEEEEGEREGEGEEGREVPFKGVFSLVLMRSC